MKALGQAALSAGLLLVAVLFGAQLALDRPLIAVTVNSESMSPVLKPGELAFVIPREIVSPHIGSIAVFWVEAEQTWFVHRIVGGSAAQGYITQGDHNRYTDQDWFGHPRVDLNSISGSLLTVAGRPVTIPYIAGVLLLIPKSHAREMMAPLLVGLGILLVLWKPGRPRQRRAGPPTEMLSWLLVGLSFVVLASVPIASNSMEERMLYVAEQSGSALTKGTPLEIEREVENRGPIPFLLCVYATGTGVQTMDDCSYLQPGATRRYVIAVRANSSDEHTVIVRRGAFIPVLPAALLRVLLARGLHWAIAANAIAVALPGIVLSLLAGLRIQAEQRKLNDRFWKVLHT